MVEKTDFLGLLDENGLMLPVSTARLDMIDRNNLRIWCHLNARYGLPTVELVEWLRKRILGRRTIEIGSGSGDLANLLSIQGTDNWNQTFPDVAHFYRTLKQPVINYPNFVEKIDAIDAMHKYRPEIILASWVTHWIDPAKPAPTGGGNMYGIKEDQIVNSGITYIMIGNKVIHKHKPILGIKHLELSLPFVRSRSHYHDQDRIFIWNADQVI